MKRTILLLAVFAFLTGCNGGKNRENINRLDVGMTKIQVLDIMGEPYRREAKQESEMLLYQTDYTSVPNWLTPLYFENGKLVGWGTNYWEKKAEKFDIKIQQN